MGYIKQDFTDGQILYASQMNHIEDGILANEEAISQAGGIDGSGAGFHNSIYRGKNLGTSYTAEQQQAVYSGTFDDMFIGDYWTIGGITWRIAHFDYYINCGDTNTTRHHVIVVPDSGDYKYPMNPTKIVTGAYYGSDLRANGLTQIKASFDSAFGAKRRLTHRVYYITAVDDTGKATAGSWQDDDGCDLMTERNVYGSCIRSVNYNFNTIDKTQYALFALQNNKLQILRYYWLQDVASASAFCMVGAGGDAYGTLPASYSHAEVRPRFLLI